MSGSAKNNLILIHSSLICSRIEKRYPKTKWIYFGKNFYSRKKWERELGIAFKINYKNILTEVSYSLKDEFIEWLAELGRPYWKDMKWWITNFATRNYLASQFYLYVCYLEVLKNITTSSKESLVIISESWEFIDIIVKNFRNDFKVIKLFYLLQTIKRSIDFLYGRSHFVFLWLRFFYGSFWEWLAARLTRSKEHPKANYVYDSNHTVIHTCIEDFCIGDDGKFKDSYYPGLSDYLRDKGKKVSILLWLYNVKRKKIFKIFKWFRNNNESFLIPQDYYNLFDCFYSFRMVSKSANFRFASGKCYFRGMNIFNLINQEQRMQSKNTTCAYFISQLAMFRRWKKLNYCLESYVDFWELRNCEVPAIIGIKETYPLCKIIAFQDVALLSKLTFFNYKTTLDEFCSSPHPDIGITNSRINKELLIKDGFPDSFIKVGPALRYKWLEKNLAFKKDYREEGNDILICLPSSVDISCEMLEITYQVLKLYPDFKALIKPHPMMNLSKLKKRLSFSLTERLGLVVGDMEKWLLSSDIVITSQTSAMIDSVLLGKKTIIIARETDIDIVPLSDAMYNNKLWKIVYSQSQLQDALEEFLHKKIDHQDKNKIEDSFFEFNMNLLDDVFV